MRERIFTVEEHFQIDGLGLVIVGKVENQSHSLKIGMPLIIVNPSSWIIETKLSGINMTKPPNFKVWSISISELIKEDVPIGSNVFIDIP